MSINKNEHFELVKRLERWRMAFFGVIILVAGLFIGSGVTVITMGRRSQGMPTGLEHVNRRTIDQLQHELHLTSEQREQVKAICDKRLKALSDIREQARPQIAEQMNLLYSEVMAVLDENQKQQWERSIEMLRDRFAGPPDQRRGPGSGPGREGYPPDRPFHFGEQDRDGEVPKDEEGFPLEPPHREMPPRRPLP